MRETTADYIAHKDGLRIQTLRSHLTGTARLAAGFADRFGHSDWGYAAGMLHDIGKYSESFQKRIQGESGRRVDHSTAGARLCLEKGAFYYFLSYCIAGHHAGLPDYGTDSDVGDASTLSGRRRKKIEDYQAYREEVEIPEIKTFPFDSKETPAPDFSMSVFIRMIYSCLVDADFLDTEMFMRDGQAERETGESLEILLEKLERHIAVWLDNRDTATVNGRRSEILRNCLEQGGRPRGLFRLTVPTGGGKTVASLAFALRHAVENHMDRVIYVIPYTSIIEQNAAVFRGILGEKNVLENHCNVEYGDGDELRPLQLAAENWDMPVIVTTSVQFFESLFANKSTKCRKLHNIANSVIIFDEAQMLPSDYLRPCTAMMEELIRNYRASVVLCTATQPALSSFFQSDRAAVELCPRVEEQFRFFERVTFENIGTITEEALAERLADEEQALCIVNTRKRAQEMYRRLGGDGVYHLSTSMYPKHRRRILEMIRSRVKEGKRCVLISTSLVEAGVDLDFRSVYRQLAGVDSIIQAAGRCNREGRRDAKNSVVSVFQFENGENVPGQRQQMDVTKLMLAENRDIFSLEGIERYFKYLYRFRGEGLDKKKTMDEFQDKRYNFATVGREFRLIEENTRTLFINGDAEAEDILRQMRICGYTRALMRKAGQYCIQVYDKEFERLYDAGMLRVVSEDMEDFYELLDGEMYSDEMGLDLQAETGMVRFL